ncbi:leucine-rich repeat domain-containing protein [Chaetoceros tenuissimus]|uniref:Leucine-rich repeat domain-containing protein n=1 Tax=Chaetoceros tenuissimus TaxID=426638 RepID=A0AAD3D1V4_9STRA|nr:leucine-rich repeat domain-containing protein [Chaetoceros tenuissimus]
MRTVRKLTNKEWAEISEKYKDGGAHLYRGKRTFFYNGGTLWKHDYLFEMLIDAGMYDKPPPIYNDEERNTWQVVIVLPGVERISDLAFKGCANLETVIMADSVKRIEYEAFERCESLLYVRLSKNLEYIGECSFENCKSLTSIFIPPSCRQIDRFAFNHRYAYYHGCGKLIIFSVSQHTQLGEGVFSGTALIEASPFDSSDHDRVNEWINTLNDGQDFSLHRECASMNPSFDRIYENVKAQGLKTLYRKNSIGITALDHLSANPYSEVDQQAIAKKYILEMMGEVV